MSSSRRIIYASSDNKNWSRASQICGRRSVLDLTTRRHRRRCQHDGYAATPRSCSLRVRMIGRPHASLQRTTTTTSFPLLCSFFLSFSRQALSTLPFFLAEHTLGDLCYFLEPCIARTTGSYLKCNFRNLYERMSAVDRCLGLTIHFFLAS